MKKVRIDEVVIEMEILDCAFDTEKEIEVINKYYNNLEALEFISKIINNNRKLKRYNFINNGKFSK